MRYQEIIKGHNTKNELLEEYIFADEESRSEYKEEFRDVIRFFPVPVAFVLFASYIVTTF